MKIEISCDHPHLRFSQKETSRTIKCVLRGEKRNVEKISVVYTTNAQIHKINRKHLGHNYVTDVITFVIEEAPVMETEIYINLDRARSQASDYGETYSDETRRLLIHGLLHSLGYDDGSKKEIERMRRKEDAVLCDLNKQKN